MIGVGIGVDPAIAIVGALAPIPLSELVERAELLTRVDRKYVLSADQLPALLALLPPGVRVLDIGGRRRFGYRSTYFDTPALDSYLTAARRRRRRFKVRTRTYLDSDQQFLEIKTRGPRGSTIKQRFPYASGSPSLDPGAHALAVETLTATGIEATGFQFAPVVTTHYERTTLFLPEPVCRVTFDHELVWSLADGTVTRHLPDRVIVETKSGRATSPVDRLLWSLGHRPCAFSKYATGLAVLRPGLPANRWHQTLQRHLPVPVAGQIAPGAGQVTPGSDPITPAEGARL
jgi:hypothetical protein